MARIEKSVYAPAVEPGGAPAGTAIGGTRSGTEPGGRFKDAIRHGGETI
ncbi:MAG TPA: hypothetical protein VL742_17015 [Casimicrobiaceae bacterium]|nr:hypothetical protein [Casimicrobiaceae bacterium]